MMRLLEVLPNGDFRLARKFLDDAIPQYAILSHTWEDEGQEVTLEDMGKGLGENKDGFKKIKFCRDQAARDGLQFFWVDSCCIDKSSSAELQEAITSMFRWYQRAAKCYVYLSDVSTNKRKFGDENTRNMWEQAFRKSKWFKRGWTLQELLAPTSVEFFSKQGSWLGDKKYLKQQIHETTGIPASALLGSALSQFSVAQKFHWAKNRRTTREEDWAYSLLGIFEVSMPVIYGEGRANAVKRLKKEISEASSGNSQDTITEDLLKRLPVAINAPFNSLAKQHEASCLANTRVDLLDQIYNWAEGQDERCIFWLNGLAGTGKSTIARTIARRYFDRKQLGASFFFARGGGDVGNASKFVTSIATQFANNVYAVRRHIFDAVSEHSGVTSLSLRDQWQMLVLGPLSKLDGNEHHASYVLVVDALDECDDERDMGMVLQLLADTKALNAARLRIFLTSRPEIPIRYGFYQIPDADHQDLVLHNVQRSIVDHDISVFLQRKLTAIAQERSLHAGWPGEEIVGQMVQIASGLFIWAATACRFIREGQQFAGKRLDTILKGSGSAITAPDKHLNEIYTTVLKHSVSSEYTDEEKEEAYHILRQVLGSIAVLSSPLSASSLSRLLNITMEDVNQPLNDLHSVLDVPKDKDRPLRLHHPSFRDFLLNKDRCTDPNYWVDEKQAHQILADRCLQLMSTYLRQDVCGVRLPGKLATSIENTRVEQHLPLEVQYACLYWVQHLQKSGIQFLDNDPVHQFLNAHLLHWLEALGWMRRLPDGLHSIIVLNSIALTCDCPRIYALIHDLKRFAFYNRFAIEQAPLQLYSSALMFAPEKSIVRKQFACRIPGWIQKLPTVSEVWSTSLATLEGHSDFVRSVAFSPDGKRLASGSDDKTVRFWDSELGAPLATLEGHSDLVWSIAFSPDGKRLASGSWDETVRLWDSESGEALATLEGHSDFIWSVAFSPDSRRLASGSDDKTVRLWDGESGEALATLEGHSDSVRSVTFSPDGRCLASRSDDKTVRLWDGELGGGLAILNGHSNRVSAVAFSPDGKRLVSGSWDKTIRLWNRETGKALAILEGHSDFIWSVVFSPDGRRLASSSRDETVRLWDSESGEALATLEGHSALVRSVAFSPDGRRLASGSDDKTVRLWDGESGEALATLQGHGDCVWSIVFSSDSKRLASGSTDDTIRLWDGQLSTTPATCGARGDLVWSIAFSPDGKRLASGSWDETLRLWDSESGEALATLEGHSGFIGAVAFSPDGRRLASGSDDNSVRLWDGESGEALATLEGHSGFIGAVAFSPDGRRLASGSDDNSVRLWDGESGEALATLEGHGDSFWSIVFSPDGRRLASGSGDDTVRLWDVESGEALATLDNRSHLVKSVAFSSDGRRLASAPGIVRTWDAESGATLQMLETAYIAYYVSFFIDGQYHDTSIGIRRLRGLHDTAMSMKQELPNLCIIDHWVALGSQKFLWLPPEYRATCIAVKGQRMAIGHNSGRVSFFRFDIDQLNSLKV